MIAIGIRAVRFAWHALVPALLALVVVRILVPTPAEAASTWAEPLARFGADHTVGLGVAAFVCFAAIAQYWWTAWAAPRLALPASRPRDGRAWWVWIAVASAAVLALGLRATVGVYRVDSASMLPTLEPLDVVTGQRSRGGFAFARAQPGQSGRLPARGELVAFDKPRGVEGPDLLVKRVVGLPGDRISMEGALVVINGRRAPACEVGPYLYPLSEGGGVAGRVFIEFLDGIPHLAMYTPGAGAWSGSYDVEPGEVFVLGDNRSNSSDSRAWAGGKGAGLPLGSIDARVSRWLFGIGRDERVDVEHLFHPLELSVRLDQLDTSMLRDNIRDCLEHPPLAPPK